MGDKSKIEWTDATWNPVIGCSMVSGGCLNCYAQRDASGRLKNHPDYSKVIHRKLWNGKFVFRHNVLDQPLRWQKPRTIFVCSMGDLFHESVPDEWIDDVMAVTAMAPQHRFMVLTKRPERMMKYFSVGAMCVRIGIRQSIEKLGGEDIGARWKNEALPNLALGVSIEDQKTADERIPILLQTPAAYRFVSYEPALNGVNLQTIVLIKKEHGPDVSINALYGWHGGADSDRTMIDLVIMGGESGPNARPMHPDWARSVRDQCYRTGIPFHFKQWGEWHPEPLGFSEQRQAELKHLCWVTPDGRFSDVGIGRKEDDSLLMFRVGKKRAGRLLDGKEHNGQIRWR